MGPRRWPSPRPAPRAGGGREDPRRGYVGAPDGAPVLDCGRAELLPGLIDCHSHLCWDPPADPLDQFAGDDDQALLERARQAAGRALAAGITTVRDLGDRGYAAVRLRRELASTPGAGPEILAAGPPLTPTKGHCWFLGGEAQGPEALTAAVDERARRGVDVVKVMATGGLLTPGSGVHVSQYTRADLQVIADRAHARGLPVVAHAHGGGGIADALHAGFDGIEHCTFINGDSIACDWATVNELAASGVVVSAAEARLPEEPLSPVMAPLLPKLLANWVEMFRRGVRLAISSDAEITRARPHDVLPHGAVCFAGLGMTNAEVLRAVTETPATACGLAARKGRLAKGYDADLVAVEGDPLVDITALLRPVSVIRAGEPVSRDLDR
ncbi:MAG: amidohydrolase family protein [Acidimicrobiia bacterium]